MPPVEINNSMKAARPSGVIGSLLGAGVIEPVTRLVSDGFSFIVQSDIASIIMSDN